MVRCALILLCELYIYITFQKITAVLAKQPPETLKSSELIVAIAAQFKDTLSPVELERIQLDGRLLI